MLILPTLKVQTAKRRHDCVTHEDIMSHSSQYNISINLSQNALTVGNRCGAGRECDTTTSCGCY